MSGFRIQEPLGVLAALSLAACASSPPATTNVDSATVSAPAGNRTAREQNKGRSDSTELVRLNVDSALSLMRKNADDRDAWLASNFSVGLDDDLLRYKASYSIEPGDILAAGNPESVNAASSASFGGQHLGQNIRLQLPELGGAPLSLGFTTESRNNWMVSGYTQSQRERANLKWSAEYATVDVQWAGAATSTDPSVALDCDLQSTVRLPMHEGSNRSEALRLSGRDCIVAADGTPYAGIEAQTWGLGYVWSRPRRQSEAVLSVIDPAWTPAIEYQDLEPSYELGFSHRRDFGSLSAKALVSVRQATILEYADAIDLAGNDSGATATWWAANASLTWRLPDASLSATWAKGVDRLWFTPEIGQRSDRFGLALNLSQWIEGLVPDASPELAMNWNWSQETLLGDKITGNNSLQLSMALMF